VSPYYVNLRVSDQPGVLAAVAGVFGSHGVSIRSMEQEGLDGADPSGAARLIFITHSAREADVRSTLAELRGLDAVTSVGSVLRVIGVDAR
jgi:homoserine dehydrogenase